MNFELFTFQQLIKQAIRKGLGKSPEPGKLASQIKEESDRILIALQIHAANMDPSKALTYIHQHQQAIHIILEDLQTLQKVKKDITEKQNRSMKS